MKAVSITAALALGLTLGAVACTHKSVVEPPAYNFCGEAACVPVAGAFISHYTGPSCTGTESYYTAYNGYDGVRRSWDGQGLVGTTLHTVTNRSYRMGNTCYTAWPDGNTLTDFVTVYRPASYFSPPATYWPASPPPQSPPPQSPPPPPSNIVCGETSCVPVTAAYISHFTGPGCTGTESYFTPYNFYDGIRRSWDGHGIVGTTLRTVTNRSYKDYNGICYDAWPSGNTLSDFVTVYR